MTIRSTNTKPRSNSLTRVLAFVTLWLVSSVVANAGGMHAELPSGIEVSVQAAKTKFSVDDQIMVAVTYKNTSSQTISFIKWGTALEGRIDGDFLSIYFEGSKLPYVGRIYKRAAPTSSDYISLQPNQQVSATVDLLTGYRLDYAGDYSVSPNALGQAVFKSVSPTIKLLADRPIFFTVKKQTPIVNSCAGNRPALIDSALSAAESLARRARDDLSNTPVDRRSEARRYNEWFGVYNQSRWNTVQSHFNTIYSKLSGQRITFICDDTSSAFAYVYPSQHYDIYLGQAFWNAPRTGTDSKAGTIIHELSHFQVVADTDDVVYGQSGARGLARNNPNSAIRNADSHEYFAENTPALSMPSPNSPPPPPPPAPDLVVTSFTVADPNPTVGRQVGFSALIENSGDAASDASSQYSVKLSNDARISVGDSTLYSGPISPMPVGATQSGQGEFPAPNDAGQYWVGVCVTAVSLESDVSNNCSGALPLVVERPTIIPPILMLLLLDEPSP